MIDVSSFTIEPLPAVNFAIFRVPRFLDVHPMKGVTEDNLKQTQMSPKDEFGVTHVNILFNPEADRGL